MASSTVKFVADTVGGYSVYRRDGGAFLGHVGKRSEHYNIARPVTVTYWFAGGADGRTLADGEGVFLRFSTRAEAAGALVKRSVAVAAETPRDEVAVAVPTRKIILRLHIEGTVVEQEEHADVESAREHVAAMLGRQLPIDFPDRERLLHLATQLRPGARLNLPGGAYFTLAEAEVADDDESGIEDDEALDMDEVCRILREVYRVENAHVADTGGGCMTIYAGPTIEVPDYGTRYAVCAGPGFFQQGEPSLAWTEEFCWGNDDWDMTGAVYAKDVCDKPGDAEEVAWRMAQWMGETGAHTVNREGIR